MKVYIIILTIIFSTQMVHDLYKLGQGEKVIRELSDIAVNVFMMVILTVWGIAILLGMQ